jgi:GT2 family glycosyltransferase
MTPVAAVIVNWNGGPRLERAVRSLLTASDAEIVVVDNASTDSSLEGIARIDGIDGIDGVDARVTVVRNGSNAGFAGGINLRFTRTDAPFVLILNPDVRALPGAVSALTRVLDQHPRAGSVGGFVNARYLPRPLPTLGSLVRENLGLAPRRGENPDSGPVRVGQAAGAALMVRRDAFDDVGGFDERYHPAWYEDVDFARSLALAQWESWYEPSARFEHDGGYSLEALGREGFMAAYYPNQFRYVRKHLGAGSVPAVKAALVVGVLLRMAGRPSQARCYCRGLAGVIGR